MSDGRSTASRAALLELRQEREVVQEGHRFLEEKRVLLAREILRRLTEYESARAAMAEAESDARRSIGRALEAHGLESLQVHPPPKIESRRLERAQTAFLALPLPETVLELRRGDTEGFRSEAAQDCGDSYAGVARQAATLAALESALLRLLAEYRRTERRVRALENLILPELQRDERDMADVLEENELEEAIRVRLFAGRKSPTG